jgi:hypothetical protein
MGVRVNDGEPVSEKEGLEFESVCHVGIILKIPAKGKG